MPRPLHSCRGFLGAIVPVLVLPIAMCLSDCSYVCSENAWQEAATKYAEIDREMMAAASSAEFDAVTYIRDKDKAMAEILSLGEPNSQFLAEAVVGNNMEKRRAALVNLMVRGIADNNVTHAILESYEKELDFLDRYYMSNILSLASSDIVHTHREKIADRIIDVEDADAIRLVLMGVLSKLDCKLAAPFWAKYVAEGSRTARSVAFISVSRSGNACLVNVAEVLRIRGSEDALDAWRSMMEEEGLEE